MNTKLTEKVETLELRIKSLEKQEKMMQGKFEQLQAQIKAAIEGKGAPTCCIISFLFGPGLKEPD